MVIASVAISAIVVIFFVSDNISKKFILEDSFNMLKAIRETKADQVETYFKHIENQLITFSEDKMVIEAMKDFQEGFESVGRELNVSESRRNEITSSLNTYYQQEFIPRISRNSSEEFFASTFQASDLNSKILQELYISSNPYPVGEKDLLEKVDLKTSYTQAHEAYHRVLHSFQRKFGYYDLFLVDIEKGNVVYSVFKEIDFGTSLLTGPHQDSKLAEVYRKAREASFPDFTRLVDFAPYIPSYNTPASFIASPIFDGDQKIGVLIFQMPVDKINRIMTYDNSWKKVGLGESGESYLIGSDFTLRNQSRFLVEDQEGYLAAIRNSGLPNKLVEQIKNLNSSIGLQLVKTPGAEAAILGETGELIFEDYRGIPVLSAFRPLKIQDVNWAILSEIDKKEALEPLRKIRLRFLMMFLAIIPLIFLISFIFARSLTRRIKRLRHAAIELANGNLEVQLKIEGEDEIGSLASSFEKMRTAIRELLEKQSKTIDALSASLIPLTDDVGVMVLIGSFDEHSVSMVRKNLTEGLHRKFHQVVILDVTGVPTVDALIVEGLVKVAKTAHLMGSQVIFSGIQADMAMNMANLNLDMQGIRTQNSLQNAINEAFTLVKG